MVQAAQRRTQPDRQTQPGPAHTKRQVETRTHSPAPRPTCLEGSEGNNPNSREMPKARKMEALHITPALCPPAGLLPSHGSHKPKPVCIQFRAELVLSCASRRHFPPLPGVGQQAPWVQHTGSTLTLRSPCRPMVPLGQTRNSRFSDGPAKVCAGHKVQGCVQPSGDPLSVRRHQVQSATMSLVMNATHRTPQGAQCWAWLHLLSATYSLCDPAGATPRLAPCLPILNVG